MRSSRISGLVLALVVGAATAGMAQQPVQQGQHRHGQRGQGTEHAWQGRGQHGGFGMLLKGIDLTDQQKGQLMELRARQGEKARSGEQSRIREQVKAAREKGDTAALRQLRVQRMAEMKQHRDQMFASIRSILTPAQRTVFDRNVADAQKRFEQRGARGQRDGQRIGRGATR